jgi:hypothetical protein
LRSSSGDPEYAALTVQRVGASRRRFETAAMDSTVRRELETLLGYMRACRQTTNAIQAGATPGPAVPDPAGYVRAMT